MPTDKPASLPEVFISVGRCCDNQKRFVDGVFDAVRKSGLRPLSSRHGDDWPALGPLEALREVLSRASGTIILAFERKLIEKGVELRNAKIKDEMLPTVWNQVEAGMACAAEHPILVVMDKSIRKEGLLDHNFPWHVELVDLDSFDPASSAFSRTLANFSAQVQRFREQRSVRRPRRRDENESIAEIIGSFTPSQMQILAGAMFALLAAVASVAYALGRYFAH